MGTDPFSVYKSGGRTRSVVNIVDVDTGVGILAYTFTETTDAPQYETDGYKNYGLNKNLHVLIKNNNAGTCKFQIFGFHSFANQWGNLNIINPADGGNSLIEVTVAANKDHYMILPIEGIERVGVNCSVFAGSNNCTVYLGVNSI